MDIVITVDINSDYKKLDTPGSLAKCINNITFACHLKQIISEPTRVNNFSSTIIDLTFTNIESKITHGVAVVTVADHLMNYVVLHMKKEPIHKHKYVRSP